MLSKFDRSAIISSYPTYNGIAQYAIQIQEEIVLRISDINAEARDIFSLTMNNA